MNRAMSMPCVWIMAIGLVLAGGAWASAAGIAYDLTKLKSVCVFVDALDPDIERHLGLSKEAISNHVYVWLKGKLPRLRVERYTGTRTGVCEFRAPTIRVNVNLGVGTTVGGRKTAYYGSVEIRLVRKTQWETGRAEVGVAYDNGMAITGSLKSSSANHVYDSLDDLLTDFAAQYYEAGNPSGFSAEFMYRHGLRSYTDGNYEEAIKTFGEYLTKFPDTALVPNAQYWLAESYYSKREFLRAIREFDKLVNKYPESPKVPSAMLKQGYAFIFVGQRTQGVATLKKLVQDFPKSREASLAREWLGKLGDKP